MAAENEIRKLKNKDLARRKEQVSRLQSARRKSDPILVKLLRNEMSTEAAVKKFRRLIPDKELAKEIFDIWDKAMKQTPEESEKAKAEMAREEIELAESERLFRSQKAIHGGISTLAEAARAGDLLAVKYLVEAAVNAIAQLDIAELQSSEAVQSVAKSVTHWPVLANDEGNWEKRALRRVADLKLGDDLAVFKVRFRKARGTDANLPARVWAKAAVRAVEETRIRFLLYGQVLRGFGSNEALADFCLDRGWEFGKAPAWMDDVAKLKHFSAEVLPEWKSAIRKIIREQLPDFHTHPDWITQRNTAAASGRDTPGEIQNAILDDIVSALARLAPERTMPKPAC